MTNELNDTEITVQYHPETNTHHATYDAVVGQHRQYETLQDAIGDDAQSILVATDYDPTTESYPITITADRDGRWKPTTIDGAGPNAVTVGDPDQEADTIQIHGNGNHYGRPVQIRNLALASHPDANRDK